MWLLYQIATALILVLGAPFFLLTRGKHYLSTVPGRLGGYSGKVPDRPLWIHAVSVGEVGVAATVVAALPADLPVLITTITPTGQRRARETFGERAAVAYLPFDLGFAVSRFMRRFRPRALVLTEGDYWPLVLHRARHDGLSITVINGRVSDRGFRRMASVRPLLGTTLGRVDRFVVQTDDDRDRLTNLGVGSERILVSGNLKYETPTPKANPKLEELLAGMADGRPILVAGSTMKGEEEAVLEGFDALGGGKRALLILAPRHPERWDEVARLLARSPHSLVRRSACDAVKGTDRPDVVLLDSLGELAGIYRIAAAAFIGGTLTPTGGHNPLEPARFGVPVVVGPSMENFRQIATAFDRGDAWARVPDGTTLGVVWSHWLENPEQASEVGDRGRALIDANRGALPATLEELQPILDGIDTPS